MKLREHLDQFYLTYNIPQNGGVDDKTFDVPLPFFTLKLPNYNWRRSKLHIHDLEHILNRQDTTWKGEMFIASWEIATGFWRYFPICIFPFWTMGWGLWKHPESVYKGFSKGLSDFGIANLNIPRETLLDMDLLQLRQMTENKGRPLSRFSRAVRLGVLGFISQMVFFSPWLVLVAFLMFLLR